MNKLSNSQNFPTEMTSLLEIKQRLAAIEQKIDTLAINQVQVCKGIDGILAGQSVLCERLDSLQILGPLEAIHERLDTLEKMLRPKRRRK